MDFGGLPSRACALCLHLHVSFVHVCIPVFLMKTVVWLLGSLGGKRPVFELVFIFTLHVKKSHHLEGKSYPLHDYVSYLTLNHAVSIF